MSDYPTCSAPNGPTVTVTIPPGWFTYVSGLARSNFNQMTRLRITNSHGTNTENFFHSPRKPTDTNQTMRLLGNYDDSYSIRARTDVQKLEFTSYYSMDPEIKDYDLEMNNAVVSSLAVLEAKTPEHLLTEYPNYITFFVFVQASPDQEETEYTPLYNDAVCTINMIKGTGLDHDGFPIGYNGSGRGDTTDGATSGRSTTASGIIGRGPSSGEDFNDTTLDIVFVQDCTDSQQPYIKALTDNIINISTKIASSARLAPDALRFGLIGFRDAGDEYVTKPFPLTSDITVMRSNLSTLVATGGGNGPEALAEALDAALMSDWRVDATKLVILITDAPPHCIGEPTDESPATGKEPQKIVRRMAELGITLHLVTCEPTLSTSYKHTYDLYKSLTKITGGLLLPLVPASQLADYIIGSSVECFELDAFIAKEGKTIARRALFKKENPEALTEEYHAKYMAAGVTITTMEIEHVPVECPERTKNIETYDTATGVVIARQFLGVCTHLLIMLTNLVRAKVFGAHILPKIDIEAVTSSVTLAKKPISKEQTGRIIELGITKHAEVLASGKFVARPTREDPVKNSISINIPAGWYGFVSGLSRIKYNQAIKLCYDIDGNTNTEFLTSELGQTDNIMRISRSKEEFYIFAASEESNIVLDVSFFWSKDEAKGSALDKPQYISQKLKVIETQTPMHSLAFFPNYITYLIMAEDHTDAEQVAGVPDFNDCVGIVNLIKKTLMVYNDEA